MSDEVIKNAEITTVEDMNLAKKRWQNRRRMAWVILWSMIILTFGLMFTDLASVEKLEALDDVITWYYLCSTSVVGAYMGVTTWASIKGIKG